MVKRYGQTVRSNSMVEVRLPKRFYVPYCRWESTASFDKLRWSTIVATASGRQGH